MKKTFKAPKGMHFMTSKSGKSYLMRHKGRLKAHKVGSYKSANALKVLVRGTHKK